MIQVIINDMSGSNHTVNCVIQYFKNKVARGEKVLEQVSLEWAKTTEELAHASLHIEHLKDQVEGQANK